ncbi:MAG: hypothetical protein ACYDBT_04925 [Desulfobulbaceae bacterium]
MGKKKEQREYYEKLAEEFFSKKELPPVEDILIALEIAKGTKFRLSPEQIKRIRDEFSVKTARRDDDWCVYCDDENHGDKCSSEGCDALDCMPGLTPDS